MFLYTNCIAKVKNVISFLEEMRQILSDFVKKIPIEERKNWRLCAYILCFIMEKIGYHILVKKLYFFFYNSRFPQCPAFGNRSRCEEMKYLLNQHLVLVTLQISWMLSTNIKIKSLPIFPFPHSHGLESMFSLILFWILLKMHIKLLLWTELTNTEGLTVDWMICMVHWSDILLLWTGLDALYQSYKVYEKESLDAYSKEISKRKEEVE